VVKNTEAVRRLLASVATTASARNGAVAASGAATSAAPASATPAAAAPASGGEARTFPMEDSKPGQEPPR
jgi:hypothetical protein